MMTKSIAAGMFVALAATLPTHPAQAQVFKEKSIFTITERLDVGGTILEPGTFRIKVHKRTSDRHTLQVVNTEDNKVFVTVLAIPHPIREQDVIPESRFVYYPATGNQPRALRTWFGNDIQFGHDIAYPKRRAAELVAVVKEPVVFIPDEAKEAEFDTVPIQPYVADRPAVAAPVTRVAETRPATLPRTASNVPLLGLLGALALASAASLRAVASRLS